MRMTPFIFDEHLYSQYYNILKSKQSVLGLLILDAKKSVVQIGGNRDRRRKPELCTCSRVTRLCLGCPSASLHRSALSLQVNFCSLHVSFLSLELETVDGGIARQWCSARRVSQVRYFSLILDIWLQQNLSGDYAAHPGSNLTVLFYIYFIVAMWL